MVGRLRTTIGEPVPDATVGGPAAQNHDLTEVLTGRAPLAIGLIMIVAFLLLLVVFRSLTIAVSSILLEPAQRRRQRSASPRSCSSTAAAPA